MSGIRGRGALPTYFFDLQMGKVTIHDRKGRELADDEAARVYALQNVRDSRAKTSSLSIGPRTARPTGCRSSPPNSPV